MEKTNKIKLADLVGKEIKLTDEKGWMREGKIFTENNKDYAFLFKQFSNCYGCIHMEKEDLVYLFSNIYSVKNKKELFSQSFSNLMFLL